MSDDETRQCACGERFTVTARQAALEVRFLGRARGECDRCLAHVSALWEDEERARNATSEANRLRSRTMASGVPTALLGQVAPAGDAKRAAWRWASDPDAPPVLVLWGDAGVGKTTIAAGAFGWALRRRAGFWRGAVALCRDLYGEYGSREREEAEWIAKGRSMLVLDDLDKVMGARSVEQLFNVVDATYANGTPLLVTMNANPDQAAKRWGELGPMIASRLASGEAVRVQGADMRRRSNRAA